MKIFARSFPSKKPPRPNNTNPHDCQRPYAKPGTRGIEKIRHLDDRNTDAKPAACWLAWLRVSRRDEEQLGLYQVGIVYLVNSSRISCERDKAGMMEMMEMTVMAVMAVGMLLSAVTIAVPVFAVDVVDDPTQIDERAAQLIKTSKSLCFAILGD